MISDFSTTSMRDLIAQHNPMRARKLAHMPDQPDEEMISFGEGGVKDPGVVVHGGSHPPVLISQTEERRQRPRRRGKRDRA
jgi:hypothetical protein